MNILILPCGLIESLNFKTFAKASGHKVIGASANIDERYSDLYDAFVFLPFFTGTTFEIPFLAAIDRYAIDGVFTPHMFIWHKLDQFLKNHPISVALIGPSPNKEHLEAIKDLDRRFELLTQNQTARYLDSLKPSLTTLQQKAVLNSAGRIYGQCGEGKILSLCEITRSAPPGDIVEIGSAWGRSAYVLTWLARHFHIGPVLCIDPWKFENYRQSEKSEVNLLLKDLDPDVIKEHFLLNMTTFNRGDLNYFQGTSKEAFAAYAAVTPGNISSEEFGDVRYHGEISILHVDGNHDYDNASFDVNEWGSLVVPGGWIVIDDYDWPFGKAPRLVADAFVEKHKTTIDHTFVSDGSLFVHMTA